jgi:hypothetical protein
LLLGVAIGAVFMVVVGEARQSLRFGNAREVKGELTVSSGEPGLNIPSVPTYQPTGELLPALCVI